MKDFGFRESVKTIVVIFAVLGFIGIATCQSSSDVYSKIPQELRERFVERITLLIEYEKTHKWGKLYELLYLGIKQNETIEQYSKRREYWLNEIPRDQFIDFTPHSLRPPDNTQLGEWIVFGCITRSEKGQIRKWEGMISAFYDKDDWYFSEPGIFVSTNGRSTECGKSK